jgi:festuclavine dehydrogenase
MTILLIGGTGKTGLRLARLLQNANQPFLLASRGRKPIPEPFQGVKFHWDDPATHEKVFSAHADIDRVYLIGPEADMDISSTMKPFIELAIAKGVKRFVMLTATTTPTGPSGMEGMHKYLANLGVEYCILRPTWFIGMLYVYEGGFVAGR